MARAASFFSPRRWGEVLESLWKRGALRRARADRATAPLRAYLAARLAALQSTGSFAAASWGSAGWRCLSPRLQDRVLDAGIWLRSVWLWAWLTFLSLTTVWTDIAGRARSPIPVRAGPGRLPAAVHLTAAESPLQLRLLAYFWRASHDQTCQALAALAIHYFASAKAPLDVSGVVVFPRILGERHVLPLPFRVRIDLVARTTTITHGRIVADSKTGSTFCAHAPALIRMNSAALDQVLSPLLARQLCPTLIPERETGRS